MGQITVIEVDWSLCISRITCNRGQTSYTTFFWTIRTVKNRWICAILKTSSPKAVICNCNIVHKYYDLFRVHCMNESSVNTHKILLLCPKEEKVIQDDQMMTVLSFSAELFLLCLTLNALIANWNVKTQVVLYTETAGTVLWEHHARHETSARIFRSGILRSRFPLLPQGEWIAAVSQFCLFKWI